MPKLLVLFSSIDAYAARVADVVADGAKSVRFTEVDVRAVSDAAADVSGRRRLESTEAMRDYDGVILVGPGPESPGHELGRVMLAFESGLPLSDTVFGIAGDDSAELLVGVARSGGVIVAQPSGTDAEERARKLGARVAKVMGWVRHALAHEAEHSHSHAHHHAN